MTRFACTIIAAAALLAPAFAHAQFVPPADTTPPPPPPPATGGDRPMSYAERQRLKAANTPPTAAGAVGGAQAGVNPRPAGFSVGIGVGWRWSQDTLNPGGGGGGATGTDLLSPNTVTARFRFSDTLTIEPAVTLGMGNGKEHTDFNGVPTDDDPILRDNQFAVGFGADARIGMGSRGSAEFCVIAGGGFAINGLLIDPNGPNNVESTVITTLHLDYGIGIDYFITPNFAISADAQNPLVTFTRLTFRETGTIDDTGDDIFTDSSLSAGLIFNPTVRIMFLLYY